jgi:tagaturonate reductase
MEKLNRKTQGLANTLPIKVIQFGEGNFLRAFVDYAIQRLNDELDFNAGVAVVQPIEFGMVDRLNEQDGLYTLFMKGVEKGEEIQQNKLISSIVKGINPYTQFEDFFELAKEEELAFIISNTTESGIAYVATDELEMEPPSSYPGKLTALLYTRFKYFNGDPTKGLTIIPCELINHNADTLKDIILRYAEDWELEDEFKHWLINHNSFHNTLVDRIVPGYPKDEIEQYNAQLDYHDDLLVTAESFFLWVIEGDEQLKAKLPFHKINLDVKIVADMQPYRTRKVRILNGVHTAMVPFCLMYGTSTVKESVDGDYTGTFISAGILPEIIDTIDMDKAELQEFADAVMDRFRNPFIKHLLSSIALNSISKFKVRVLPSIETYIKKHNKVPTNLTFSFACLLLFYKRKWNDTELPVQDSDEVVAAFHKINQAATTAELVSMSLGELSFWDKDLNQIKDLHQALVFAINEIENYGIEVGFAKFNQRY